MERCVYAAAACVLASGLFLPPPVPQFEGLPGLPNAPRLPGLPPIPGLPSAPAPPPRRPKPYMPSLFQILLHKIGLLEPLRRRHKALNRAKEMYLYGPESAFSNRPPRPRPRPTQRPPAMMPPVLAPPEVATISPLVTPQVPSVSPQAPQVPDDVIELDYYTYQDGGGGSPAYDYFQAPAPQGPDYHDVQVPLAVHYGVVEPNNGYSVTTRLPDYDPFNGTLFNEHVPRPQPGATTTTTTTTTPAPSVPADVEVFGREQTAPGQLFQLHHPDFRPVQELIQPLFNFGSDGGMEGGTIYRKVEVPLSKTEMMVIIDKVPVKQANLLIRNSHHRGFDFGSGLQSQRVVETTTAVSTTTTAATPASKEEEEEVTPPTSVSAKWVTIEEEGPHHSEVIDAPTLNETDLDMLSDYYEDLVKADLVQDYTYQDLYEDYDKDKDVVTGGRWITVETSAPDDGKDDAKPLVLLNRLA